jgi:hypothetical protein
MSMLVTISEASGDLHLSPAIDTAGEGHEERPALPDDFHTEDPHPMSTRLKTLALLTASAAVGAAASAQSSTLDQTTLGRMAPLGFATTTPSLMSSLDLAIAPSMVSATERAPQRGNAADANSSDFSTWTVLADVERDDEENEANSDTGFFGSTMGRASMIGVAGLAGASYLALRSDGSSIEQPMFDAVTSTLETPVTANLPALVAPSIVVTPEPAGVALMAVGLGGIALVARRRGSI